MKTFRQVSMLFFLLCSNNSWAESSLYDELKFLEESSQEVEVFLPGEQKRVKAASEELVEDSISTGQAGLLKTGLKSDNLYAPPKPKKALRLRSR